MYNNQTSRKPRKNYLTLKLNDEDDKTPNFPIFKQETLNKVNNKRYINSSDQSPKNIFYSKREQSPNSNINNKFEELPKNNEEYHKLINKIMNNIFKNNYKLLPEDYIYFDKVINHKSISQNNYEILETIGDGLLKSIIIQSIIKSVDKELLNESYISELRMLLERTEIFSYLLTKHFNELENYINYKHTNNPYDYEKIKEDVFEALIGAIYEIIYNYCKNNPKKSYLLLTLKEYYINIFIDYIKTLQVYKEQLIVNEVKQLSEYCMKNHKQQPIYKYTKINTSSGIVYEMTISLDGHIEKCTEKTQKKAKQRCASLMLYHLNIIQNKKINKNTKISNIIWNE